MEFNHEIDHRFDKGHLAMICGMMKCLSCLEGATITKTMAAELEFQAEWFDLYISDLIKKDQEPEIMVKGMGLIDLLDEGPGKVVKAHEGSEDSPPSPQPADQ